MSDPIAMILYCPRCHTRHIDKEERCVRGGEIVVEDWAQIPHRSHKCHRCTFIWRPADVPTVGVAALQTCGKDDTLEFAL